MTGAGIDGGKSGAIAMYDGNLGKLEVCPCPLTYEKEYDLPGMLMIAHKLKFANAVVALENAHAFPGEGGSIANFQRGAGFYAWMMALTAAGVPFNKVPAQTWRKHFGLVVKAAGKRTKKQKQKDYLERKQRSLALARERFGLPFKGPKGGDRDGEAEAGLMALYAWEKMRV